MKTKIKSRDNEFTDFYDEEIRKLDSNHTCLAVISLDSVLKKGDNCYPQMIWKECKRIEKKVTGYINDNFNDFPSSEEFDEK